MKKTIIYGFIIITTFSCNKAINNKLISSQSATKLNDSLGVKFSKRGNIVNSKSLFNNDENGICVIYRDSVLTIPKYIYHTRNGKRDGLLMTFRENGILKSLRESDIFSEGQYIEFNDNGSVKFIGRKVNGKINGWSYNFDKNGMLKSKILYKDSNVINEIFLDNNGR